MRKLLNVSLSAGLMCVLATGGHASAGDIGIETLNCKVGVHLAADEHTLSEIMERLSMELGFEFISFIKSDPVLTVDITRQPADLIVELWPHGSSTVVEPDPDCDGKQRLVKVRLLEPKAPPPIPVRTVSPDPAKEAQNEQMRSLGVLTSD
jgi:hypothetical protein